MGKIKAIQVGAGPNGLLQTICLLEKYQDKIDLEIYEQRDENFDKFRAMLVLTEPAFSKLPSEVLSDLRSVNPETGKPKAYTQDKPIPFNGKQMVVEGAVLIKTLLKHLREKYHVEVKRGYRFYNAENRNGQCVAFFYDHNKYQKIEIPYDICTLSLGSGNAKSMTETAKYDPASLDLNYTLLHKTPNIIAWYPLKEIYNKEIKNENDITEKPNIQVFAHEKQKTFVGYLLSPDHVAMFATCSPEMHCRYTQNENAILAKFSELLKETKGACPDIVNAISNSEPIYVNAIFSSKTLSLNAIPNKHIMSTGDGNFTSDWIWGGELQQAWGEHLPVYLQHWDQIVNAHVSNIPAIMSDYSEEITRKINSYSHVPFNLLADPYGYSRTPDGDEVPLCPWLKDHYLRPAVIDNKLPKSEEQNSCGYTQKQYLLWAGTYVKNAGNALLRSIPRDIAEAPQSISVEVKYKNH